MSSHHTRLLFVVLGWLLACDNAGTFGIGVGAQNGATMRIVNVSGAPVDVTSNGQVLTGGAGLANGTMSSCFTVDATSVDVAVRASGGGANFPGSSPLLASGGTYTIVAFPGAAASTTQLITLSGSVVPSAGTSALRILDAAPGAGPYDVYVTVPGAPLGAASAASLIYGSVTPFFDIPSGSTEIRFTFATTNVVAIDAGPYTIAAGTVSTLVLAAPFAGSSVPSVVLVPSC